MRSLDCTLEGVTAEATIHGSLRRLLGNIAVYLRQPRIDATARRDLSDMLDREAEQIASAVVANVPMVIGSPPANGAR